VGITIVDKDTMNAIVLQTTNQWKHALVSQIVGVAFTLQIDKIPQDA
jgi:hypothetical protein